MSTSDQSEPNPSIDASPDAPRPPIGEVCRRHDLRILQTFPEVSGIYVGTDPSLGGVIRIIVDPALEDRSQLPSELEGWPVLIDADGPIFAAGT